MCRLGAAGGHAGKVAAVHCPAFAALPAVAVSGHLFLPSRVGNLRTLWPFSSASDKRGTPRRCGVAALPRYCIAVLGRSILPILLRPPAFTPPYHVPPPNR